MTTSLLAALTLVVPGSLVTRSAGAAPPEHLVVISGLDGSTTTTWPAYDPTIERFAVASDDAGTGLSVRVETSESGASISVEGRPVVSGEQLDLPDVRPGDEVNVQVTDSSGTSNQSWFYLPPGFPAIATTRAGDGPGPGMTGLTLRSGSGTSYSTTVDEHGVPSFVMTRDTLTADLNRQPNQHYSVAVASTEDLYSDWAIEEYDEQFRLVTTHRIVGHPKTDFHDSILLPGGGRILMAYIKAPDGQTDSWLQEVDADGEVVLDWNSRDHMDRVNDPILNALGDYAHLNSFEVMSDGHLLLSFRHLNQVMKIHRTTGEVLWRLGGRRSDFDFVDDPLGGPCAQHTARELANGDIQIFDNGSANGPQSSNPLCPEAGDPEAGAYRPFSRVTVYRLDQVAGEASLVQDLRVGAFSQFAGSAQRLGASTLDDHVLVGMNNAGQVPGGGDAPDALELDADGNTVWSLTAPGVATYRAERFVAPDRTAPEVTVTSPADGAILPQGHGLTAAFGCTDTGGANLAACEASTTYGTRLSDVPGTHRLVVRATDREGNATTRTVTYTVVGAAQPTPTAPQPLATTPPADRGPGADAMIRKPGDRWKGRNVFDVARQTVTSRAERSSKVSAVVRVRNNGATAQRIVLRASTRGRGVTVRWYDGEREVTSRLFDGELRTPRLRPGASVRLRVDVTVGPRAPARSKAVRLAARAPGDSRADVVRLRVAMR